MARPYRIGARIQGEETIWTTRLQAESALTTAVRWLAMGRQDVVIVDTAGREHDLAGFRAAAGLDPERSFSTQEQSSYGRVSWRPASERRD